MQKFSIAERRNRLARRHFLYRNGLESIAGVNAGLVGLHAIDPATPDMPPWCALLPGLDATTMGWYQRDWYLGEHRGQVFDANGNAGPTAWCNGRVVGGSHRDADARVQLQLLEDPGRTALRVLQRRADELTWWLDGVRINPRFPSRLAKAAARRWSCAPRVGAG